MTAPTIPANADTPGDTDDARELADYLAGQDPLDVEAALWLARRQDGLTTDEESELRAWLAGNPARGGRLEHLAGVWGRLGDLPADEVAALKAALQPAMPLPGRAAGTSEADQTLRPVGAAHDTRIPPGNSSVQQPGRRQWLLDWGRFVPRFAVAGMAAMALGGGWLSWNYWHQQPTYMQSFATARGQQLTVPLPDGSTLMLDTATRLEVTLYRERREVRLSEGQTLFEVKADAARPFYVLAGTTRITVLGTRFSVRHSPNGQEAGRVSVVVEEGRVRVARITDHDEHGQSLTPADSQAMTLTAGQSVIAEMQGGMGAIARIDPDAASAWYAGRVVFDGTPLAEAIAEIERYVDTGLVIADPTVASLRLNGSFDLRQAHTFKRVLPLALPVRLVERGHVTDIVAR